MAEDKPFCISKWAILAAWHKVRSLPHFQSQMGAYQLLPEAVLPAVARLFLLLENTMQVGDVVTLGGMSGTVENLSIRTIRLRALDGEDPAQHPLERLPAVSP